MKKIYYEKQGRRYVPVAEYDNEWFDSLPKGDHLISVYPGGSSRRYKIDPAFAPMIAAGRYAEEAMCSMLIKASEMRPRKTPLTTGQKQAWNDLVDKFGDDGRYLEWASAREVAEAGVKAMADEAEKLLSNESIRKAYEHFLLLCALSNDSK